MASPGKAVTVPDVSAMAYHGLLATLLGQWEITLDEGTYIWGRVDVKSLKNAVIVTDEIIPCSFSFRQRDDTDLRAVPGVPSVIAIHWEQDNRHEYATLEKQDKDFLTWRSPPLPDGSLGQHNVWKRIGAAAGIDEVAEVRAKAADELAKVRKQAEDTISKAVDDIAEARDELAEVQANLTLASDLADARASVADEIAEENFAMRKQLDAEVVKNASLQEQVSALTELLMMMKQREDGEPAPRTQETPSSDIQQPPTLPNEALAVDLTSPDEANAEVSTPPASTPPMLDTTPEAKPRTDKRAGKEASQEKQKRRRTSAGANKRQAAGMDIRAALKAGGA